VVASEPRAVPMADVARGTRVVLGPRIVLGNGVALESGTVLGPAVSEASAPVSVPWSPAVERPARRSDGCAGPVATQPRWKRRPGAPSDRLAEPG
jgi:hypothetical protein